MPSSCGSPGLRPPDSACTGPTCSRSQALMLGQLAGSGICHLEITGLWSHYFKRCSAQSIRTRGLASAPLHVKQACG